MTDPLVVLVFVMASGQSEPTTPSMTAAARQALGANTLVLVEERAELPSSEQALAVGERVRAGATVTLDWVAGRRTFAIVHVHTTERPGWAVREIDFDSNEPAAEYGRALGFAVASMITGLEAPDAAPAPAAGPQASRSGQESAATAAPDRSVPAAVPNGSTAAAHVVAYRALQATAVATTGVGSGSNALGAMVDFAALLRPWLAVQLDAGLRFGNIPEAQATTSWLQIGGGATWRAIPSSEAKPFELDLRADMLATQLIAVRAGESRSRWLPDASLTVNGVWFVVTPNIGIVLVAGLDASFGTTSVALGTENVANIQPFRAIGALGIRARF